MEEYWPLLETKVRKLIFDLLEPSAKRVKLQGETIENQEKAGEHLKRRVDGNDILIDRITSKLSIIEEFARRLTQFEADLRISEVEHEGKLDKLQNELDLLTGRVKINDESISALQGLSDEHKLNHITLSQELSTTKTVIDDQVALLKNSISNNQKESEEAYKKLEVAILMNEKKLGGLARDIGETDLISKKASRALEIVQEDLNILNELVAKTKLETKDQVEKIRMMAIQYNHMSNEGIKRLKDVFTFEFPIKIHSKVAEMLYLSFSDLKTSKQIAEAESKSLLEFDKLNLPSHLKEKVKQFEARSFELMATELPVEPLKPKKKKKKFKLSDMLSLDTKIKTHEEKMKNLEEKIVTIEGKQSQSKLSADKESDSGGSDDSEDNLEILKQNAELLAKFMGVRDFTQDIEELKELIRFNQEDSKEFSSRLTEFSDKFSRLIEENLDSIGDVKEHQAIFGVRLTNINEYIQSTANSLDRFMLQESADVSDLAVSISNMESHLDREILKVNSHISSYIEDTSKQLKAMETQVQQALNECNTASAQRKRDHNDNATEFLKLTKKAESFVGQQEQLSTRIELAVKSINNITEFLRIGISLQYQDELDRDSVALMGYKESKAVRGRPLTNSLNKPTISLDKQCISCSGQVNLVTSAFKIACLAYTPSLVNFRDNLYPRLDLLDMQKRIIESTSYEPLRESSVEHIRNSKTPKPSWRPPSSLSSYINSGAPYTPDLPPISLSRRVNNYNP